MRVTGFCVFDLLILLALFTGVTSQSSCYVKYNGCSVPFGLDFIYKSTFKHACNKHDVCYNCGQRWGWSQKDCDERFKTDMYKLCEVKIGRKRFFKNWFDKVKLCKNTGAESYYSAVRTAGHLYYENVSPDWCKETCTKEYGDPAVQISINR